MIVARSIRKSCLSPSCPSASFALILSDAEHTSIDLSTWSKGQDVSRYGRWSSRGIGGNETNEKRLKFGRSLASCKSQQKHISIRQVRDWANAVTYRPAIERRSTENFEDTRREHEIARSTHEEALSSWSYWTRSSVLGILIWVVLLWRGGGRSWIGRGERSK